MRYANYLLKERDEQFQKLKGIKHYYREESLQIQYQQAACHNPILVNTPSKQITNLEVSNDSCDNKKGVVWGGVKNSINSRSKKLGPLVKKVLWGVEDASKRIYQTRSLSKYLGNNQFYIVLIYIPLGSLFSGRSSFCKSLGKQVKFISFYCLTFSLCIFHFLTKL